MPRKPARQVEVIPLESLPAFGRIPSIVEPITRALLGGIPSHGITEMYGAPSGGKSTIALTFLPTLYIDIERSLSKEWAAGISPALQVAQPDTLDAAMSLIETVLPSKPRLVVLDSLGGGVTEAELTGEQAARMSALTSRWLRRLNPQLEAAGTALLIVNQLRASLNLYGSPTTTPGGNVLHHLALLRVEVRRMSLVEVGERKIGQQILLRTTKSKVGPPFAEGVVFLDWKGRFFATAEELKEAGRR